MRVQTGAAVQQIPFTLERAELAISLIAGASLTFYNIWQSHKPGYLLEECVSSLAVGAVVSVVTRAALSCFAERRHNRYELAPEPQAAVPLRLAITPLALPPDVRSAEPAPRLFATISDSSGAFHALFGQYREGAYYCENAAALRRDFCAYLQAQARADTVPTPIRAVIDEYFFSFSEEATPFYKAMAFLKGPFYARFAGGEEEAHAEFVEAILPLYLENRALPTTHLLPEELLVMAAWKGLSVRLLQAGKKERIIRSQDSSLIDIHYKDPGQYQRA